MSLFRSLATYLTVLLFAAALVPAFAFAQSYNPYPYNCNSNSWNFLGNNNSTLCGPGNLLVYVQVTNNSNFYNNYANVSSDFTVAVSGQNVSPASFPGSLSGTQVTVTGPYSVTALQLAGYTTTYSTGCTGTINQGQQALCVVTESNSSTYNTYPTPYPYNYYNNIPLTCAPSYQTVNLGQTVTFTAQGGNYSQYNWTTPSNTYLNAGQTLNVPLLSTGTQTITVSNGQGIATCTVNVVPSGAPVSVINPINPIYPTNYPTNNYGVSVTPVYVPRLPNTGFAPMSSAEAASAVALLIAAALIVLPYVRQAFTAVLN
jgi:hypothetical protein